MTRALNYNFVKNKFEKRGYILKSTEYKNRETKLEYSCPKGCRGSITWGSFKQGNGCKKCAYKKKADKKRLSIEKIRPFFLKRGYKLLSTEYKGSHSKIEYACPEGHKGYSTWDCFQQGHGCRKCAGNEKLSIEQIRPFFSKRGYTLLNTEYKGANSKLKYICPLEHQGNISWSHFQQGQGCPKCCQGRSEKLSREILEEIMGQSFTSVRPKFLKNPETNRNLELDGYCENLNLAFEYQGRQHYKFIPHWHKTREKFEEQQERDEIKYKMCVKNGITLILIPYKFNCYKPDELRQYIRDQLITHGYIFFV